MRVFLTDGTRQVDLRTDPSERVSLRAAEHSALRLFRSLPTANQDREDEDQAFGFSLSSDTERALEADTVEADDDD